MFRPSSDYVLTENGRVSLVQGSKRTPFASDVMASSFTQKMIQMSRQPEVKSADPKIKAAREAEWEAFFRKPDSGLVSPEVISRFSMAMGLSVRQGNTPSQTGDAKGGTPIVKLPGGSPGPTFPEAPKEAKIPQKGTGCVLRPTDPNCDKQK